VEIYIKRKAKRHEKYREVRASDYEAATPMVLSER